MAYIGRVQFLGTATLNVDTDQKRAWKFTAGRDFTAEEMGFFGNIIGYEARLGIYSDDNGEPDALLGYTSETTITGSSVWWRAPLTSSVSLTQGNDYWLAIIKGAGSITMKGGDDTTGTCKYNNDTYSDGFSDPFGATSSLTYSPLIFATTADFMGPTDLSKCGAVVETSGGIKYLVTWLLDYEGMESQLEIYKNIDTAPTLVSTVDGGDIIGSTNNAGYIDAAIDGNNKIHVVVAADDTAASRDIAYRVFDTSDDSWEGASWEEVTSYTNQEPFTPEVATSIASDNTVHILYVDNIAKQGTACDAVYHAWGTAGSWSTEEVAGPAGKNDANYWPNITLCAANDVEALYYNSTGTEPRYRRKNGTWGTEGSISVGSCVSVGDVIITTGDTPYRYLVDSTYHICENSATSIGYDAHSSYSELSCCLVSDSVRYVFHIDPDQDVHLVSNDGSGWTDEGDLQVGSYERVIAEWAYNFENQSDEINYVYSDGEFVYYDSFSLAAPADSIPYILNLNKKRFQHMITR